MKTCCILPFLMLVLLVSGAAQTPNKAPARKVSPTQKGDSEQRRVLKEYTEELQKTPDDDELREKIVKLATTLRPPPEIPEEARRDYIKAVTLQKEAKTPEEVAPAIAAYEDALLLAPWWADAYYNLSSALELAGRYNAAIDALKLYLATNPKDSRATQDRIYAIEAEQEHAAIAQRARAKKQAEEKAQQEALQAKRDQEAKQQLAEQKALEQSHEQEKLQEQGEVLLKRMHREWTVKSCDAPRNTDLMSPDAPGCTVAEANGNNNWHVAASITPVLPGNGTIVFAVYNHRLAGTPHGTRFEDMSWECTPQDYPRLIKDQQFWPGDCRNAPGLCITVTCSFRPYDNYRVPYFALRCPDC